MLIFLLLSFSRPLPCANFFPPLLGFALLRNSGFLPLDMHLQTLAFFPWTQASSSGFRSFILSNCTGLVRIRAFHSLDSVFPCPPASSTVSRCNFYFTLKSTFLAPVCRRRLRLLRRRRSSRRRQTLHEPEASSSSLSPKAATPPEEEEQPEATNSPRAGGEFSLSPKAETELAARVLPRVLCRVFCRFCMSSPASHLVSCAVCFPLGAAHFLAHCRMPPLTCSVPPRTWTPDSPRGQPRGLSQISTAFTACDWPIVFLLCRTLRFSGVGGRQPWMPAGEAYNGDALVTPCTRQRSEAGI
eukprot:jgi/Botrbrau1/17027/Bobra.49_2s0083.1